MKSSLILIKLNNWGKVPPTIKMEGKFDKYTLGEQKYTSTNAKGQSSVKRITVVLTSKCWWKSNILLVNCITIINCFRCCLIKHASQWVLTWSLACNFKRQHGYHGSKNCAGIVIGNRWIFPSVAQDINQSGFYFFICMFILKNPDN